MTDGPHTLGVGYGSLLEWRALRVWIRSSLNSSGKCRDEKRNRHTLSGADGAVVSRNLPNSERIRKSSSHQPWCCRSGDSAESRPMFQIGGGIKGLARRASEWFAEKHHSLARRAGFCRVVETAAKRQTTQPRRITGGCLLALFEA